MKERMNERKQSHCAVPRKHPDSVSCPVAHTHPAQTNAYHACNTATSKTDLEITLESVNVRRFCQISHAKTKYLVNQSVSEDRLQTESFTNQRVVVKIHLSLAVFICGAVVACDQNHHQTVVRPINSQAAKDAHAQTHLE